MPTIKQHIPNFCDFKAETFEFSTLAELLNIEFVKNFSLFEGRDILRAFHRYSISIDGDRKTLMAEYGEGRKWWVIGYIKNGDDIIKALPLFNPKQ